jgi:cysteinyl-tRNA synthetase
MSKKYLGEQIDIHAGGEDLVFPHHENEIAQSEACNGKEFARYWMHNAFLNIDNKKMSKSDGNFFTVREISEKYPLQVLRFFMLSAHYRSPINFSRELMEASQNGLERILTATYNLEHLLEAAQDRAINNDEKAFLQEIESLNEKFDAAMEDDFNTADAISAIFEIVKAANSKITSDNSKVLIQKVRDNILQLSDILGIQAQKKVEFLAEEVEQLIQDRQAARKNREFAKADEIRDLLLAKGIILEDTREGVRWKRA